jgi:hypothetical protein
MPLGFDPPHPGGMTENSPTFQRWVREFRGAQVPKGRLKPCAIRQPSLRDLSCCGRWFPTLKRWAIIACPSGTKTWPGFADILWDQILATLDKNVRAPPKIATAARASLSSTRTRLPFLHPLRRQAPLVPRSATPAPLCLLSSLTCGQDRAEPEVEVAVRRVAVADRRPAIERVAVPTAAPKHADRA